MKGYYIVRYGRKGEQLALYMGHTTRGAIRMRKYLANSRRWTGVVTVAGAMVLREATPDDLRRFGVKTVAEHLDSLILREG